MQILGIITRNITYKEYVCLNIILFLQAWIPICLEKIQTKATKLISGHRDLICGERLMECGQTTLEKRRLRGSNTRF